jgi:Predicted membrane protein
MKTPRQERKASKAGLAIAVALAFALMASTGQAQNATSSFVVVGVGAGDVLYVRSAPDAQASIVGALTAGAQGIQALDPQATNGWRRVRHDALEGWVNARFLAVDPYASPAAPPEDDLRCSGTEPFWGLKLSRTAVHFTPIDGGAQKWGRGPTQAAANRTQPWTIEATGTGGRTVAVMVLQRTLACSDGMSEQTYAYDVVLHLLGGPTYSGCCGEPIGGE